MRPGWSRKLNLAFIVLVPVLLVLGQEAWYDFWNLDGFFWPESGHRRIEDMAAVLKRIKAPARWCYPSENKLNLLQQSYYWDTTFNHCVVSIQPATDFIEKDFAGRETDGYAKRFYRATLGSYVCEVTLSTDRGDDRIVGSDCYYGLFRSKDDKGVGMTDDPFG